MKNKNNNSSDPDSKNMENDMETSSIESERF